MNHHSIREKSYPLLVLNAVLAENNADDMQTDPNYSITFPNIEEITCRQKNEPKHYFIVKEKLNQSTQWSALPHKKTLTNC